jgi:hypothetical protein
MHTREGAALARQIMSGTDYGAGTVWRCTLGLALLFVVTVHGTYETAPRAFPLASSSKPSETVDDVRAAAHRKALFDARRVRFEQVEELTALHPVAEFRPGGQIRPK